jgi:hypothetical protein
VLVLAFDSGEQLDDKPSGTELVTDQRRGEGVLPVEGRGQRCAVEEKRALIIVAAIGADGARRKPGAAYPALPKA